MMVIWLVVTDWNHGTLWLSICWEFHIPNWRTHIFQRGSIPPARQWFSGPTCTDRATVPLDDTQYLNLSDCAGQLSCTLNTRHDLKDMAQTASYLTATIFWQAHNGSRKICQRKTQKYHEISINMQKCCNVNQPWMDKSKTLVVNCRGTNWLYRIYNIYIYIILSLFGAHPHKSKGLWIRGWR